MFPDYTFLVTVVTWTNSSMQNSMVMVMFISVFDWEYLFLGKLDPKNGNYQLRLKFITYNHFHNILRFFDVGCWTLVDSVLWNHTCLFVRPSVRLSICPSLCPSFSKFSQDFIISFFWYCTWWQLIMISSGWRSQMF